MDGMVVAFFVPTVIFLCIVAPVWIFMHYRSKQNAQGSLSEVERVELESLTTQAQRMMDRVETLESILDSETPDWRQRLRVE
ncbi:MAG: envelope stress response membrane protein PspB [Gammaproteobacteria bacterium]|nr:envelope stress response membrane protein PspB [Gammaproteobacteria bacterium]